MTKPTKNYDDLSYFNWFDAQRVAFLMAFFIGTIGVITLKELGFGPIFAIAFSGISIFAYVVFEGTRRYHVAPATIGDNIYYLGFLFTLVSLSYTLYKFSSSDNEIDQIIQNFGIALSTTLMGVVGRVYFHQTSDIFDQPDAKSEAMASPFIPTEQMSEALVHASAALKSFNEQQAASIAPLSKMVGTLQASAQAYAQFSDSVSSSTNTIVQEMERFEKRYAQLTAQIQERAIESNAELTHLQENLSDFAQRVGETKGPSGR